MLASEPQSRVDLESCEAPRQVALLPAPHDTSQGHGPCSLDMRIPLFTEQLILSLLLRPQTLIPPDVRHVQPDGERTAQVQVLKLGTDSLQSAPCLRKLRPASKCFRPSRMLHPRNRPCSSNTQGAPERGSGPLERTKQSWPEAILRLRPRGGGSGSEQLSQRLPGDFQRARSGKCQSQSPVELTSVL